MPGATSLIELILKKWGAPAAGVAAAGQSDDADAGFITKGGKTLLEAWHGSPHKFDKFSMDQIGTGEGAQAYGHGLYFTDTEGIARGYRDALSDYSGFKTKSGIPIRDSKKYGEWGAYINKLYRDGNSIEVIAKLIRSDADRSLSSPFKQEQAKGRRAQKLAEEIESGAVSYKSDGSLYRTEIDVTPESLLDWDKPLSEQSEAVRNIAGPFIDRLSGYGWDSPEAKKTGADLYSHLTVSNPKASSELASKALSDRGIKGIKYLDGDSRAVGDGTSNYVIFDDSLINIAERGNADPRLLAGIAGTTAAGLAAPMIKDSGMISAPRSETLFDLTMGARDLERRLEGSPASLLFPSGLVEYLETVNRREEDPNAMTRGMALLDVLPF